MLVSPKEGKTAVTIECLPKASFRDSNFQLPILETGHASSVPAEVLDHLEIQVSKSETVPPLINTLYRPEKPFAQKMIGPMASAYTHDKAFLRDTQSLLKQIKSLVPDSSLSPESSLTTDSSSLSKDEETDLLAIWKDFAENPDFLDKYGYLDWEAFQMWNYNYYFMQTIGFVHGVLPMINMLMTLFVLMIPLFWIWSCGLPWSSDSYMECIRCIGGENQMFCHVLGFMDKSNTFAFQNLVLLVAVMGIYGFQFYYNIIHTQRFFRHFQEGIDNLRKIKRFFEHADLRMEQLENAARDLDTYAPFLEKMSIQRDLLRKTVEDMPHVSSESSWWHEGTHLGNFLNTYYQFYEQAEMQQLFQYCVSLEGYMDNMENLASKLASGEVHCADFDQYLDLDLDQDQDHETEKKENNSLEGFYYPALSSDEAVRNNLCLDSQILLTGPNAAGKTTLIKSVALNFLFSQQTGVGFYEKCRLTKPYRHFHSYMNIPDTSERDSLFEAESRRCKQILTKLEEADSGPHLCIFDELFSGTNPKDATNAATSFLKYLHKLPHNDFLLTTHYVDVCKNMEHGTTQETGEKKVTNYKMLALEEEGTLKMTYQCVPGISEIHGASYVLEKMEFPQEIIDQVGGNQGLGESTAPP